MQRNTAIAYARGGDVDRAESYLKSLRALPDSEGSVALLLGEIAFAKGNWEEALTQLQKGMISQAAAMRIIVPTCCATKHTVNWAAAKKKTSPCCAGPWMNDLFRRAL